MTVGIRKGERRCEHEVDCGVNGRRVRRALDVRGTNSFTVYPRRNRALWWSVLVYLMSRGNHPRTPRRSLRPVPPPDKAVAVLLPGVLYLVFNLKFFSRLAFDIRDPPNSNAAELGTEGFQDDIWVNIIEQYSFCSQRNPTLPTEFDKTWDGDLSGSIL